MNNNSNTDLTDKSLEKKFSELKEGIDRAVNNQTPPTPQRIL